MTALRPLFPHQTAAIDDVEVWLPVVGYCGTYEVSSHGRVRSCARSWSQLNRWGVVAPRFWPERILKQTVDRGRYAYGRLQVKLCSRDKQITRLVHQIVAEAFIGPRPAGMEVAHNDGNPANNHVSNLRYATPRENTHDKVRHGTILAGSAVATAKLTSDQVASIRSMVGKRTLQSMADEFGVSIAQVSRVANGKQWRGAL